ncbi:MAG: hypothetical protein IPM07_29460 [Anaerolineales bacterium]|nr:hypothetical protein [Anaerolineales bacterium]
MLNSQLQRLLVVGAVTFIVLLFSSSQAEAGSRTFRAWTRLMVSFEQVCKDGIRFGMADSDPYTYKVEIRKKGQSSSSTPLGVASGLSLESRTSEDSVFSNRYCDPAPMNPNSDSFVMLYCRGAYGITWNPPLNVGDEIDLYVYKRNTSGTYSSYDFNVFPLKPLPDQGFQSLRVSDCNVNDLTVAVAQAGPDSDAATVTDALVFEVHANDPNWGSDNGDGIKQVDMSILAANDAVMYSRSQVTPISSLPLVYCAFGSYYQCGAWVFKDNNNLWPNGQPIQNGAHTLQVVVTGHDGNTKTITKAIDMQLQPPDTTNPPPLPLQIPTLPVVSAGGAHTCAVTTSGKVYCWGGNASGQLGTGDKVDRQTPVAIPDLAGNAGAVSAGGNRTCVLLNSGEMRCYGADGAVSLAGIAAFSSGDGHSCALTTTGGVKCWGENEDGQLGNGTYTFSAIPVDVQGLANSVAAISAGGSHMRTHQQRWSEVLGI